MAQPETLPQHFLEAARRYGDGKVAVRQKRMGIWQQSTWRQSCEQVHDLTLGLVELGLQRGERVILIGDNDQEYFWANLAIMSAGAVTVGVFTDVIPEELQYLAQNSDATFAFAQDQEQCDKLLEIREHIPLVKKVIYWDDSGMWSYDTDWMVGYRQVQSLGRQLAGRDPGRYAALVGAGRGDDPAAFCYTSGTTGKPKGAVLTHRYFLFFEEALFKIDPRLPTDNHVSFLSLAWVAEHVYGVTSHVVDHFTINFPESPGTLQHDIREIAPEELLYNSRLWENVVRSVQVRIADSTWINRKLYDLLLPVGYETADRLFEKRPAGLWLRLQYALGKLLLFNPLRDQIGMSRVRTAHTTGAALSPQVVRFFRALGINLKQVYGATEAGIAVVHRDDSINFYSVGQPIPGFDIQISPQGEILLTSPALFLGYHKNPEATRRAIYHDEQGHRWFRTGDAGRMGEGDHLIYYDRLDDMIELSEGESYSPQYIEGHLKFNPAIRDVMTVGGREHDYVTAIITLDFENVGRWAEKRGLPFTTFADLSQKPEVYDLLREEVQRVNRHLPPRARVRRFVSLHKEFDPDEGEMTRTRKLRRSFLQERYGEIIAAMYNGTESVRVSATVQYRDGRTGVIETDVKVAVMDEERQPA